MKNVFYPHIFLRVLGRFLTLLFGLFPISCMIYTAFLFMLQHDVIFLLVTFFLTIMEVGGIYICRYFWTQSWGKLIVTDTEIVWKCFFCKTIALDISKIIDVSILSFTEGNYVRLDVYNTGFRYVILSETNIPYIRVDKIKCKPGIIKFQYSDNLRDALKCKLSRKLSKQL